MRDLQEKYNMSFTAASLRPELARIVAERYVACRDWALTKQSILADNALQSRSPASAIRMEQEFRHRLQTLTTRQIEILSIASLDDCRSIAWLSVLKYSVFVFDFAADVVRGKIEDKDPVMRPSDYENFVTRLADLHPELLRLSVNTQVKVRRVMKTMLREAGILDDTDGIQRLQRPVLSPDVAGAIRSDNPKWLAGFLVPDPEIMKGHE